MDIPSLSRPFWEQPKEHHLGDEHVPNGYNQDVVGGKGVYGGDERPTEQEHHEEGHAEPLVLLHLDSPQGEVG